MLSRFLAVLIATFFAGCISKFPEGVPTAMIRFTSNVPTIIVPLCSRDDFIMQGWLHVDTVKEVSPVKMYGTRADKNNEVLERLIPADGRTILLRMRYGNFDGGGLTQCDVLFSLTPKPGEQFQADYSRKNDVCGINVYRLTQNNGVIQKTAVSEAVRPEVKSTYEVCGPKGKRFIP